MARATRGAAKKRTAGRTRPRLVWTLLTTAGLALAGFAAGLVVGAIWEEPDAILPLLRGGGEEVALGVLAEPEGDTAPPPDEVDAGVPERPAPEVPAGGEPPPVAAAPPDEGPFAIQVGSFTEPVPAWKLAEQLGEKDYEVYVDEGAAAGTPRWRVRVGPFDSRRAARGVADRLKAQEGLPTWILADGGHG